MNDKQEYYVGLVLSYIIGIAMTPIYFALIGVVRLLVCVGQILSVTFLFTPKVVTAWQVKCWEKQNELKQNNTNLN